MADFKGKLKVLQRLSEFEFAVKLDIMRSGVNRNKWNYQNIDECYKTFVGTPILCAYVGNQIGDGHNCRQDVNPTTGETTYSWTDGTAERIVGTISDDEADISLEEREGETWVVAKGRIFAFYNSELVEKIISTGEMDVSAETLVQESYVDGDTEVFTKWVGIGVTVLGDDVEPAVPNARIEMLAAMREELKSVKLKAAQYRETAENEKKNNEAEPEKENELNGKKDEVKQMNELNKKQIAELNARFEGHTVLAASEDENGKINVCLMSADGATETYVMDSLNDTIVPEKITKVNAKVNFNFGEADIAVDVCDITDECAANLTTANNELEKANAELEAAKETIKTMQTAEEKRRVSSAKAVAQATLDKFNENRTEKVDAKVLEAINADIDNGLYTNMTNAEGEWLGEKAVEEKVLSVCAKSVMDFDKASASANNSVYLWERDKENRGSADDGTIGSFLKSVIK